jgi:two-component system sensor histidine kinase/response regulator
VHTVLVVDDHRDFLELLQLFLQSHGYRVFTAEDGFEAVDAVERHSPDAIVMDLWMPRLDGVAATRRIRDLPAHANVPVIAFTAHQESLKGNTHLFNRVCLKPCSPDALVALVADVLRGAK